MTITITLPIPPRTLSPNARSHFHAKGRAVKAYRAAAKVAFMSQVAGSFRPKWKKARVQAHWFQKRRIAMDGDNALASLKAAFDGLSEVGLFDNDRGLTHDPVEFHHDPANPRIELVITSL